MPGKHVDHEIMCFKPRMENVDVDKGTTDQEAHNVNDQEYFTRTHNVYNINKNFIFEIGMKFVSEEESYNAYNSYAMAKGFGIRKGPKTHNRNNEMTMCLFFCSCQGQSDKLSPFQERKRQRLEYTCGCLARIKFKISNGIWEVCEFSDEHSHPMIEGNLRHFIQSGRKLTSSTKNILGTMIDAGIRTKRQFDTQNEAGGIENAGFIEQDAHNFVRAHKRNMISSGDAQTLINHFRHLHSEDSNFFYSFQVDEDVNSWLQKLYDLRKKWCFAFSRSIFSADIKSTQRSESTNRVFTEMACKTMSIIEFVKQYEQWTTEMHDTEATEDYKCQGKLKLFIEDCGILKHANSVYSRRIFTRWTKNAKHECGFEEYTEKKVTLKSSMTIRLNGLMKESFTVMTLTTNDVDSEEIARKYLYLAKVEIIKH
ncbi:hypothetical protein H5410_037310 [Solanum commersonii]|uniref:FAR1 domain-containing protein n=1 Tax=Solanum commersonii TaxID=4109 RepID=A0A9J5YAV1_SOLCO|nr:hypothetical protein H5410_037310 [Solanum commersonii]